MQHLQDLHAQEMMYQAVYVADQPAGHASAAPAGPSCWFSANDDTSLHAATAGLALALQAAKLGVFNMRLTGAGSKCIASGLSGLLKSLAAETSTSVTVQQDAMVEGPAANFMMRQADSGSIQPLITELDMR